MPRAAPIRRLLAAMLLAAAPAAAAELYKWVDENGVTNYSNVPPAAARGGKSPVRVEDRLSVYTPEASVTEALERARQRHARPLDTVPPLRAADAPPKPVAPPPAPRADPGACRIPGDPACPAFVYDASPVFHGRLRHAHPPPAQLQLPPGTIAGNVTGPGYIPGLSTLPPPVAAPPPPAPAHPRPRETEREGWGR